MATGRYVANDHHGYRFALMPESAGQAPSEEKKMMKRDEHKMSKNAADYDEETARDNYFNPPAGHRSGPGGPTDA